MLFRSDQPINRITNDGGKTWTTTLFDSSYTIKDSVGNVLEKYTPTKVQEVVYPSKNFCMAICDSGYYWISRDACSTWEKNKFKTPDNFLFYLNFINENIGLIANVNRLFLTKDSGYNWLVKDIQYANHHLNWTILSANLIDENTIYMVI